MAFVEPSRLAVGAAASIQSVACLPSLPFPKYASGVFDPGLLYFRHRDWVVRLARRFTGSDDNALDVLQETFAYLFRKFPGFHLTASMTTFLYPVVKNLSLATRRKRGRFVSDGALLEDCPAPHVSSDDSRNELAGVMAALGATHREAVLMRFVDGMSLEEIAQTLAIPLGTVKSRLHHALAALREDPRTRGILIPYSPAFTPVRSSSVAEEPA
jgi:RNA polymerase sigma-70 factor (ECF subfamily)